MVTPLPCPRVALIQISVPADSTPATQLQRATDFIIRAASENVVLAVLSEMFLGWTSSDTERKAEFARQSETALSQFQALAKVSFQ
jgi:predicted amidohydrolase